MNKGKFIAWIERLQREQAAMVCLHRRYLDRRLARNQHQHKYYHGDSRNA